MEVLQDNVCFLCQEVTAVLTPRYVAPYIKYLLSTFFDGKNEALQKFQTCILDQGLCALCSHQVVVAHKFKDAYEDVCKKSSEHKKPSSRCFLCLNKGVDLIETESNPNNFIVMISSFMETTLFPRSHVQCVVCFDCIFYLNIWFKVFKFTQNQHYTKLSDSTSSTSPTTRTKAQKKVHFHDRDTVIGFFNPYDSDDCSDQSASTSERLRPRLYKTKKMRRNRRTPITLEPNLRNKRLKTTLKKQLKHLRTIKQLKKKVSPVIVENPKMYLEIPYVLLSREKVLNFNASNMEREESKSPDLIEISDSEENGSARSTPTIRKKAGFKIKMSANFLTSSDKGGRRKQQSDEFTCTLCNKTWNSPSEYKLHILWHEKPEIPFVNIVRSNFSLLSAACETEEAGEGNENLPKDLDQETNELESRKSPEAITDTAEEKMDSGIELDEKDETTNSIAEVETSDANETTTSNAGESNNIDTEESKNVDAEENNTLDTHESNVDVKESKVTNAEGSKTVDEESKNVDAGENKTLEGRKNINAAEDIDVDAKENENDNAKESENVYAEEGEAIDAEESETIDAEESATVNPEESETIDAGESNTVNPEESKTADAEEIKNIDAEKSKTVDAEESTTVDVKESRDMDVVEAMTSASGAEEASSQEDESVKNNTDSDTYETSKNTSNEEQKDTQPTAMTEETLEHDNVVEVEVTDKNKDAQYEDITQTKGDQIHAETHENKQEQIDTLRKENKKVSEANVAKDEAKTFSGELNEQQDEFHSDSESIDCGVDISSAMCAATDNGVVNTDSEDKVDANKPSDADFLNDHSMQNKKRSLDDSINKDDCAILENGDDDFHKSKRIKCSDSESDIATAKCTQDNALHEGATIET